MNAAAGLTRPGARGDLHILIAEDDWNIASNLHTFLELKGFEVDVVYSGHAALHRCSVEHFDVIMLDIGLPGPRRAVGAAAPARRAARQHAGAGAPARSDRRQARRLERGADDQLTEPFALAEVEARIRALLNRAGPGAVVDPVRRFGRLEYDTHEGQARVAGQAVRLTPKAAQLLELLMRQPGRLVRRQTIEDELWPGAPPQPDALRSQIHWLRKALSEHGFDGLETVHGVGLRLVSGKGRGLVIRRRRSLAERVVWAVTMTVAIFLGLQSVVAFVTLHAQEDDLSDTMLQREVQQIVAHILQPGLTPTGTLIDSTRVSAWLTRDGVGGADIPANLRGLAPGLYQFSPDHKTLHVAVTDTEEGRLTVVLDATSTEARVYQFGYTLLALWLICVAATVWIARGVAAITVGPLVAATRNIARSAPDEAVPEGQHADEASLLMETFNRYRDRADEMVEREREFAANLDHEIRTPLTAIRTDAELIGMEADLAPAQRARLERITAAVDEIIATTESTLSHSAGRVAGEETVDLRDFLTAACEAKADRADARGLRVVVEIGDGELVRLDRQALLTVVRNLFQRDRHASPATLRITGDRRSLSFIDDGPGIVAARLERVFGRHQHGHRIDEGAPRDGNRRRGLGLAIVRRLCDLQGWRISVRSPAEQGRGTAFLLAFSAPAPASEQARADVDQQRQHRGVEQVGEDAVQRADAPHRLGDERDVGRLARGADDRRRSRRSRRSPDPSSSGNARPGLRPWQAAR